LPIVETQPEPVVITMARVASDMRTESEIGVCRSAHWVPALADLGSDPNSVLRPPVDQWLSSELGSDPNSAGPTHGASVCEPQWVSKNINNNSNQHRLHQR